MSNLTSVCKSPRSFPTVFHGYADRYRGLGEEKHDSFRFRQGTLVQKLGVYANLSYTGPDSLESALGRVWDADPAPTSLQPWINHVIQLHAPLLFALTFFPPSALCKHCYCCPPRCRNLLTRPLEVSELLTQPNIGPLRAGWVTLRKKKKMFGFHGEV